MVGKKSLSLVPISLAAVLTQNKHRPLILSEVSQLWLQCQEKKKRRLHPRIISSCEIWLRHKDDRLTTSTEKRFSANLQVIPKELCLKHLNFKSQSYMTGSNGLAQCPDSPHSKYCCDLKRCKNQSFMPMKQYICIERITSMITREHMARPQWLRSIVLHD